MGFCAKSVDEHLHSQTPSTRAAYVRILVGMLRLEQPWNQQLPDVSSFLLP